MGYSNALVRVYIDVLGPMYILPGPLVVSIYCYRLWDVQAEGMP